MYDRWRKSRVWMVGAGAALLAFGVAGCLDLRLPGQSGTEGAVPGRSEQEPPADMDSAGNSPEAPFALPAVFADAQEDATRVISLCADYSARTTIDSTRIAGAFTTADDTVSIEWDSVLDDEAFTVTETGDLLRSDASVFYQRGDLTPDCE